MTSWRDITPEAVQGDLDRLIEKALEAAEVLLAKNREFLPFGVAISVDGDIALRAAEAGQGEPPASQALLELLYDGGVAERDGLRATAFVADVFTRTGNAVRISVEHRDGGPAVEVLAPYKIGRFSRQLTFGPAGAGQGTRRVWTD